MATIHTIDAVRKAYVEALSKHASPDDALRDVAEYLCLPVEAVQQALEEEQEA